MNKKSKSIFYRILNKFEKTYYVTISTLLTLLTFTQPALAGQPRLVSGTVALFQAATGWLLVIIPVGAGLFLGYHALQKSMSDDQAIIAEKNRLMKNVLIGAVIAETASGLASVVLSFYS